MTRLTRHDPFADVFAAADRDGARAIYAQAYARLVDDGLGHGHGFIATAENMDADAVDLAVDTITRAIVARRWDVATTAAWMDSRRGRHFADLAESTSAAFARSPRKARVRRTYDTAERRGLFATFDLNREDYRR